MRVCKCGQSANKSGRCRECQKVYARIWRATDNGKKSDQAYERRSGRTSGKQIQIFISSALRELIQEAQRVNTRFQKALVIAEQKEVKAEQNRVRAFVQKIFQPTICLDCGVEFETLYPRESIAFGITNPLGAIRCRVCARQRRLKNHGGGPRRRCKQFGVPYEIISPTEIFRRDGYRCQLCDGDLDMSAGPLDSKAAQIDHIIPLSEPGSPGHIFSNVQSSHRRCNILKGGYDYD